MSDFPFVFTTNYKQEQKTIKPTGNFEILLEAIAESYDILVPNIFYIDSDGAEIELKDNQDYIELINNACESEVTEVELIIHSSEDMSKSKKKKLRKRSSITEFSSSCAPSSKGGKNNEDNEGEGNNDDGYDKLCDYDFYGDNRNKKSLMEEGLYSKHGKSLKERKRIEYIKDRQEQIKEEARLKQMNDDDGYDSKKEIMNQKKNNRKRQMKNNKKGDDEDEKNMDIDYNENDDEDDGNKRKKKKKGKKQNYNDDNDGDNDNQSVGMSVDDEDNNRGKKGRKKGKK